MRDRQVLVTDEADLMARCRESARKLWNSING
jgi:hypothetical protein